MDAYEIRRRAKLLEQSDALDKIRGEVYAKRDRAQVVTLPEMDDAFYPELREFLRTQAQRISALATS